MKKMILGSSDRAGVRLGGPIFVMLLAFSLIAFVSPSTLIAEGPPPSAEEGVKDEQTRDRMRRKFAERRGVPGEGKRAKAGAHGSTGRLMRMGKFLGFLDEFHQHIKDPYNAIGIAAFDIKETRKKQGDVTKAVPELEAFLEKTSDQEARNILLFMIRQVYEETKNAEKQKELTARIMEENLKAVAKE